jgi:deoxyribonuclease V
MFALTFLASVAGFRDANNELLHTHVVRNFAGNLCPLFAGIRGDKERRVRMDTSLHPWDLTVEEAIALQKSLATRVQQTNGFDPEKIRTVAGVDASYKDEGLAAISILSFPDLKVIEEVTATARATFPYVPGLLSFRETPLALRAFEKLPALPDLIMVDGQGLAHPRRFGIACHLGLLLDCPTIGVAKSRLVGTHADPGENAGDTAPLIHKGETIGMVLRSKPRTNPLFISVGHKVDLETAVAMVMRCFRGYRLPEPTRFAHLLAAGQSQLNRVQPLLIDTDAY